MAGDYERFYERGLGHPDPLIIISLICKEQGGWTYEEYLNQPKPLIEAIKVRLAVEGRVEKRKNDELERSMQKNGRR